MIDIVEYGLKALKTGQVINVVDEDDRNIEVNAEIDCFNKTVKFYATGEECYSEIVINYKTGLIVSFWQDTINGVDFEFEQFTDIKLSCKVQEIVKDILDKQPERCKCYKNILEYLKQYNVEINNNEIVVKDNSDIENIIYIIRVFSYCTEKSYLIKTNRGEIKCNERTICQLNPTNIDQETLLSKLKLTKEV